MLFPVIQGRTLGRLDLVATLASPVSVGFLVSLASVVILANPALVLSLVILRQLLVLLAHLR